MSITLIRVVNQQTIHRSLLLDKLDDGQANTMGYAHNPRNKVYVPFTNTTDVSGQLLPVPVKGYLDLIPSDRVLLSANHGTISGLKAMGKIDSFAFSSALVAIPTISGATHSGVTNDTTINGTTYLSVTPDVTYVKFTSLTGATQTVASTAFSTFTSTQIKVADASVTIGTPGAGWKVTVKANSRSSVSFTL